MPAPTLTLHDLNRATLQRQLLLERATMPVLQAIKRLIGLQSQIPNPPYIGLWSRLHGFRREDLTSLITNRQIVRAAMLRSTLHLVAAGDYQQFRPALQPALVRALNSFFGKPAQGIDVARLVAAARAMLDAAPRTNGELGSILQELEPDRRADALAYIVRTYLPLVQVPPAGTWGIGTATYVAAEAWLGSPVTSEDTLPALFLRYLAAFGPASVMDFQTWTGMPKLKDAIEPLRPTLRTYRSEDNRELFDLPDALLPPANTVVPPRFLPEYDNLLIAHADRTRIIADADRSKVFLSAARVQATVLLDGFVRGTWRIKRDKKAATLVIEPFDRLDADDTAALADEGARLLRFIEDKADSHTVEFVS